jgi:hypothetical protein
VTLVVAFLAVVAVAVFVVVNYFLAGPSAVDYSSGVAANSGATVHVVMQEDPQNTVSTHPDWVSYFIQDPSTHQWVHSTVFKVPAGSQVVMTIYGFDSCTPLRNPYWGRVTGTTGGVAYYDGKVHTYLNSWGACNVAHTFSIPGIGLNVPISSPSLSQAGTNAFCGTSPCTTASVHGTVTFSFNTPKTDGSYFWQCRIPCGGGFIDGFGGPMQTIGFMTGNMEVVS